MSSIVRRSASRICRCSGRASAATRVLTAVNDAVCLRAAHQGSMRGAVYVNGTIAPADQACSRSYDHGFVYGEGVYETLRTYNRVPFLFDRHMRACASRRSAFSSMCRSTTRRCGGGSTRPSAAAGDSRRSLHPHPPDARRRRSHYDPRHAGADHGRSSSSRSRRRRARVPPTASASRWSTILRNHPQSVNPIIKSNNLLNNALAMQEALSRAAPKKR